MDVLFTRRQNVLISRFRTFEIMDFRNLNLQISGKPLGWEVTAKPMVEEGSLTLPRDDTKTPHEMDVSQDDACSF